MKTKIIYISGNEIFDMAEIRAAFDEVRDALGLDNDTVLFGVPVDKDSAIENTVSTDIPTDVIAVAETDEPIEVEKSATEEIPTYIEDKQTENTVEQTTEDVTTHETVNQTDDNAEKIIPILSVLAINKEEDIQPEDVVQPAETDESTPVEDTKNAINETEEEPGIVIQAVSVTTEQTTTSDDEVISKTTTETVIANAQSDNLDDIIDAEAPKAQFEKTLEGLLDSMTPLREDHETLGAHEDDDMDSFFEIDASDDSSETDATLEKLASEFAQNADKIVAAPKPENQGKIGKLKNILPFKKAKRDDTGLMGDLFGWAGIAANDEDFSIPGFFTTNASKKQGA
ncbi:MAG: hypothetical protein IJY99_03095 [Alphaproteobacteria bacterium]|nr:hypothetical protein [Alphaproteobacteria bacterium]